MDITVEKRDGELVSFNINKIVDAIFKAAQVVAKEDVDKYLAHKLALKVYEQIVNQSIENDTIWSVEKIQDLVERTLIKEGYANTAKEYILYRRQRSNIRDMKSSVNNVIRNFITKDISENDDARENLNINSAAPMGAMLKVGGTAMNAYVMRECMKPKHAEMHKNGIIHYHDMDFSSLTLNCLEIPLDKLLRHGFSTGHGHLRAPSTIGSASTLTCIAIQSNQNDCFNSGAF